MNSTSIENENGYKSFVLLSYGLFLAISAEHGPLYSAEHQ